VKRRPGWLWTVFAFGFVAIAACGAESEGPTSSGSVPWLSLPPSNVYPAPPSPGIAPPIAIPAGTPACKAAQLEGSLLGMSAATGHTNTPVAIRNTGSAACYLSGYTDLIILDASGHELVVATGAATGETFFRDGPAVQVLMQPGTPPLRSTAAPSRQASRGQAFMNIEWYDCRGTRAASLSLDLPHASGNLTIAFDVIAPSSPVCDSSGVSAVGLRRGPFSPAGYAWPPEPKYLTVDIAISAPASAKRGSTLVYFVTVKNADNIDYRLDPCPDYVEILGAKLAVAGYQLNCKPVRHIPADASVKFEMRLDVPATLSAGPSELTWALSDGRLALPYGRAPIEIT
jgi:hypothetical protein